ncbi:MAG: hypothetical protein ACYC5N_05055 [Endomicrobiales bacterium]
MKKYLSYFLEFFSDREDPREPHYDPVHVGAMVVLVLLGMSVLFWLLWSLLVFGGGLQAKLLPFLQVVLTSKTAADFGYEGYPYAMGAFEGWVTNLAALVFLALAVVAVWYIFKKGVRDKG